MNLVTEVTGTEDNPAWIRGIRHRLKLTQLEFSRRFGIPLSTFRSWEQGVREPDTVAIRYLTVIDFAPETTLEALAIKFPG